jgi:F-type H+-transporting ATPase subunit a
MHHLQRHVLVSLPRFLGVDLSVTNEVLLLWSAAAATFALLFLACRRRRAVAAGMFQNLVEALIEGVETHVVRAGVGHGGQGWGPFLLSLFFFILFANLLGAVPAPGHVKAVTSCLSVAAGLALTVFAVVLGAGVRRHGPVGFARKFLPSGVPRWAAAVVLPIEVITWLARPFSLAIRLFANMTAGHALILVFAGLVSAAAFYLKPLPLAGAVAMSAFELFVCFIQAFIFTLLAGIYIGEALEEKT